QLAAVAGRQLDETLLQQLASDVNITAWQQRIGDAAILSIRDNQWEFAHDKLRETLLTELDGEEQQDLHRQMAEAIEQVYPEDASYDEALLEHWHQAGDLDKEIHYLNPVAKNLVKITADYARARVLLERGLQALPEADVRSVALRNWLALSHERQGQYAQTQAQAQKARELATQFNDRFGLATSLHNLGNIAYRHGDYNQAQDYFQQSLRIRRDIGDQQGIASSLNNLGGVTYYQGDHAATRDYLQQSLAIRRDIGDQQGIASSLNNLGNGASDQGEYEQAHDYYQQSLSIWRDIGDRHGTTTSLINLGLEVIRQGKYEQAHDYLQQSLSICRDTGDQRAIAVTLHNLGVVAYHQGDYGQACDYLRQSLAIKHNIGDLQGIAVSLNYLGFVYLRIEDELTQATFYEALTVAHSIQATPLLLISLLGFARLYLQQQDPIRAGKWVGLAQHHPARNHNVQGRLGEVLPLLEAALPAADLEAALARGKALDLETVVAELLAEFGEDSA
ncbi:MAG: tetratricopeptide repeat protein, partial [Gammaproteobacteria bacterium]|nr:tetratricopeptide repeat protein [Gammaproteobacteria bacterium]